MTEELVLTEIDKRGVATVTLNRAEVHNALNEELAGALRASLDSLAAQERHVRTVVLAARGKSFSAGADLKRMRRVADMTEAENKAAALEMADLFDRLNTMPMPTVARVQGSAFAGGVGLVACCDIAVGADEARFAITEVRLGLIPAMISPYVTAAIGPGPARRYCQTAERFDAAEAKRIGLLHEVVPANGLDAAVGGIVENILKNAPASVAASKRLIRETVGAVTEAMRKDTASRIAAIRATAEGKEGLSSFLEKRKADWVAAGGD
jgi:methylglutaconyl-CoA hydratase